MIVAMISVRMMQVTVDEIVNVVPMWHRFVAAPGAMDVARRVAAAARCTLIGIVRVHFEPMLVYMIAVRVMQMTVMQIVDVIVMPDRCVAAIRTMLMVVMRMVWFVTGAHGDSPRGGWGAFFSGRGLGSSAWVNTLSSSLSTAKDPFTGTRSIIPQSTD
ncbi:hypothetical protein [Paraburkholderia sp. BL10I2N1]|uniref:hypothetical protein n=1 Tax=Paraburkholderia sp. BL10I2N1 TaxID=1938796 RepID=UPI001AAD95CD|nr:hypothetical protein [Paraburkholderia sp. BL10I2N1]